MSEIKDGGPAFPATVREDVMFPEGIRTHEYHHMGMSLRDWFAGQAIAGSQIDNIMSSSYYVRARAAYEFADAMLRAREGK